MNLFLITILLFITTGQVYALDETDTLVDFVKRKEAGKLTKFEKECESGWGCMPAPELKSIDLFKKITFYPNADIYCQDNSSSFFIPKKFFETKTLKEARTYCRAFSSNNISDNNPNTAWCEGVNGDGIGEVILVGRLPYSTSGGGILKIWNGFGKSKNVYRSNNRIKGITLIVYLAMDHSNGDSWTNLYPIKTDKFKLKDLNGYQEIRVPKFKPVHREISHGEFEYTFGLGEGEDVLKPSNYVTYVS